MTLSISKIFIITLLILSLIGCTQSRNIDQHEPIDRPPDEVHLDDTQFDNATIKKFSGVQELKEYLDETRGHNQAYYFGVRGGMDLMTEEIDMVMEKTGAIPIPG